MDPLIDAGMAAMLATQVAKMLLAKAGGRGTWGLLLVLCIAASCVTLCLHAPRAADPDGHLADLPHMADRRRAGSKLLRDLHGGGAALRRQRKGVLILSAPLSPVLTGYRSSNDRSR